jgi:hypothetical protein
MLPGKCFLSCSLKYQAWLFPFSSRLVSLKGQICLDYHYCVVEGRKKEFSCTKKKKMIIFFYFELPKQGVTKRCRLSWVTNIALVYEPKCGGKGVAGP